MKTNIKSAQCGDGHVFTSKAATYKTNAFGLYDMHGNVWVWLSDCWHDTYAGAPENGLPRVDKVCAARGMRGGSYISNYTSLRSAARHQAEDVKRFHNYGIRIDRDLNLE